MKMGIFELRMGSRFATAGFIFLVAAALVPTLGYAGAKEYSDFLEDLKVSAGKLAYLETVLEIVPEQREEPRLDDLTAVHRAILEAKAAIADTKADLNKHAATLDPNAFGPFIE